MKPTKEDDEDINVTKNMVYREVFRNLS